MFGINQENFNKKIKEAFDDCFVQVRLTEAIAARARTVLKELQRTDLWDILVMKALQNSDSFKVCDECGHYFHGSTGVDIKKENTVKRQYCKLCTPEIDD